MYAILKGATIGSALVTLLNIVMGLPIPTAVLIGVGAWLASILICAGIIAFVKAITS